MNWGDLPEFKRGSVSQNRFGTKSPTKRKKMSRNQSALGADKQFDYNSLEEAFPDVSPGIRPYADRVIVQIRTPKNVSAGGIILPDEARETELWNTQVGKIVAIGDTCFVNQDTLEPWAEGKWFKVGDYVRVSKYGGDRWRMPIPGRRGEYALFCTIREVDAIGEVLGNPLDIVAYLN